MRVFQELSLGEKLKGYVTGVRADGKVDLSLHPPGRERVDDLEKQIIGELVARGGYWSLCDKSPAELIYSELVCFQADVQAGDWFVAEAAVDHAESDGDSAELGAEVGRVSWADRRARWLVENPSTLL